MSRNNNPATRRRIYSRVTRHEENDGDDEEENSNIMVVDVAPRGTTNAPSSQPSTATASSSVEATTTTTTTATPPPTLTVASPVVPAPPSAPRTRRPRRRPYSRVAATADDEEEEDEEGKLTAASSSSSLSAVSMGADGKKAENDAEGEEAKKSFTVTVLDFTQKKFEVPARANWTVARFKAASAQVHKVPIALQRLIFRGKLLLDGKTLEESGIIESGTIVHLFPKPRVVINNRSNSTTSNANGSRCAENESDYETDDNSSINSNNNNGGARVPTIVLDANEAEQRSHILVLGSAEYIEAQNNVKLFSFMLLIISSIELLNLLAIALGVPQDEDGPGYSNGGGVDADDIFPPVFNDDDYGNNTDDTGGGTNSSTYAATNILYQQWGWANYVDLIISMAGVYVAIMGIQASTENTLRQARIYLIGTVLVGISWLLFNYFITVEINEAVEEDHRENHPNDDLVPDLSKNDLYAQALSVMVLPAMVWIMCCLRAAQFHHLLREAEEEAETRIQSELDRTNVHDEEQALHDTTPTHEEQPSSQSQMEQSTNGAPAIDQRP